MSVSTFADRVKDSYAGAPGTGDVTLTNSAPTGFRTFDSQFGHAGTHFYYVIDHNSEWEVGEGHLSAAATLVRDTVLSSSNAGAKVNFTSGINEVYADIPAANFTQGGIVLLSSTTVHANTAGKQNLYTVPSGKHCVVTHVIIRSASASLDAMGDVWTYGFDTFADEWGVHQAGQFPITSSDLVTLNNQSDPLGGTVPVPVKVGAPSEVFGTYFNDNSIVGTVVIDVLGYLY